jgi:hypothetical protein
MTFEFILYISVLTTAHAQISQAQFNSAVCQGVLSELVPYLENGGDPNLWGSETAPLDEGDAHIERGSSTPLGNAVRLRCVEAVRILLAHGANPNLYSWDTTPLLYTLYSMQESEGISDEETRDQALTPLREIRDLLLSRGAICDSAPAFRRRFIGEFRGFLSSTDGHCVYVYCMTNQIVIDDRGVINQFDIPIVDGRPLSGYELKPILAETMDVQKAAENVNAYIIGKRDIVLPVLTRYKIENIPAKMFIIPDQIACDAKTVTELFRNNPNDKFDDMMQKLNEFCPGVRMNILGDSEVERLLAL